jgi:hypothetical protein
MDFQFKLRNSRKYPADFFIENLELPKPKAFDERPAFANTE